MKHDQPGSGRPGCLLHRRRSVRLQGYDYSQVGAYFITIVTQGRASLFGDITDTEMRLNDAGEMVADWWSELGRKYPHSVPDAYGVMPNHFHGILILHPDAVGADLGVCPGPPGEGAHIGAPLRVCPGPSPHVRAPVPEIVQWFKTMTTNAYIHGVNDRRWPPFSGRLWQRNYYEHIIRNEEALGQIREYILNNPIQWQQDRENPSGAQARTARPGLPQAWEV